MWQIDNYQVARFYSVSPDEVEYIWTNAEFLDRQEWMIISGYLDKKAQD